MQSILRNCIVALILVFVGIEANASHYSAGEFEYKYLSPGVYDVTLYIYRDCGGVNLTGNRQIRLVNKCGQTYNTVPFAQRFTLTFRGKTEVSQTCPTASTTCGTGTTRGVERFTYRDTLTIPSSVACGSGWYFVFNGINRDAGIENIQKTGTGGWTSSSQSMYLDAFVDTTIADSNQSAVFTTEPAPYVCVGQTVNYSLGASDPDGDSLVFEFADAQRLSGGTNVDCRYNTPTYTGAEPIPGILIDRSTGDITFTTAITAKWTVRVNVLEYKQGSIRPHAITPRDFQVWVDACPGNSVPVIAAGGVTNVTGGSRVDSTTVITKPGSTLCYEVSFTDANAADTVTVTTNAASVLPGTVTDTSLGVNPANGQVCWTAPTTVTGSYNVSFLAKDNNCPVNGAASITTTIQLAEDLNNVFLSGVKESCFGNNDGSLTANHSGGIGPFGYVWDSAGVRITATGKTITNIPSNISYSVTVIDSFDLDSVKSVGFNLAQTLPVSVATFTVTDISCNGGCTGAINITSVTGGNTSVPGVNGYNYSWSPSGDTVPNPTGLCAGTHLVTITDDFGCDSVFSYNISQQPSVEVNIVDSGNISCKGGTDGFATARAAITSCGVYSISTTKCTSFDTAGVGTATGNSNFGFPTPFGTTIGAKQQYLYLASELQAAGFTEGRLSGLLFTYHAGFVSSFNDYSVSIGCTDSTNLDSGFVNAGSIVYSATTHTIPFSQLIAGKPRIDFSQEYVWDGSSNIVVTICFSEIPSQSNLAVKTTNSSFNSVAYFTSDTSNACLSDTATNITNQRPDIEFLYCEPGINFSWNTIPAQTDTTATNLPAGTYIVTATNFSGCDDRDTVTLTEPLVGLILSSTIISQPTCNGLTNGSASVQVTGGTPGFTFAWPAGVTTSPDSVANNLQGGVDYVVTVTDAQGCTDTHTVRLTDPPAIFLGGSTQTNVLCAGDSTGSITVVPNGGTAPYTSFAWNPNVSTTTNATNLWAGNFSVTVTDNNGCTKDTTFTITEPANGITFGGSSQTNILCRGDSTGTISVVATGGTTPYASYTWNPNVSTTANATNLWAGTFSVTVTDANGCTSDTSFTLTEPASSMTFGSSTQNNVTCRGDSTGSITVVPTGGTTPYTAFAWNPNVSTTASATNLWTGSFTVTVTDNNGCTSDTTFTITEPATGITFGGSSQTNILCNGDSTGSITLVPSGGSLPYTSFNWNPNVSTTASATNLWAGTFNVTVTDNNGCTNDTSFTITEPANGITFGASLQTNVLCNGDSTGSITVVPAGGTTPYTTFAWSPNVSTTASATNLWADNFTVTVTDNNGCTSDTTFTITEPANGITFTGSSQTNVLCAGDSSGTITVVANGGTTPYASYAWNPNVSTTASATNLWNGSFTVTVTDANGCTADTTFTITAPPNLITFGSSTQNNITCRGDSTGSITVVPSGGATPYTNFAWNPNVSTTANATNLWAGSFSVTVTDNNGCIADTTFTLTEPATGITFAGSTQTNILCNGDSTGSITVVPSGGATPYASFAWNPNVSTTANATNLWADNFTVTVTDANGCTNDTTFTITEPASGVTFGASTQTNVACNGDSTGTISVVATGGTTPYASYTWSPNVSTTANATNLWAGNFSVTVTDANGCTYDTTFTITQPGNGITFGGSSQTNVLCNGDSSGTITVVAAGGTPPYLTYTWNPNVSSGAFPTNLWAGSFSVTVTDVAGCTGDTTFVITTPSNVINFAGTTKNDITCKGDSTGSISIVANGGTPPYASYTWNPNVSTTANATNLWAGTFNVTVTDANGCFEDTTIAITEPALGLSAVFINKTNPTCTGGGNDGSIHVQASNGTRPYTYNWGSTSGTSSGPSDSTRSNMVAGPVNVTVTDASGCTFSLTDALVSPGALSVSFTDSLAPTCFGDTNGRVIATPTGGTGTISYTWTATQGTTGTSDSIWINARSESITVLVTDALGCTANASINLGQPDSITFNPVLTMVGCKGDSTGKIVLSTAGGTPGYSYSWNPASLGTTDSATNLWAGNFSVTITDANLCTNDTTITITEPAIGLSGTIATTSVNCFNSTNGTATLTPSGGTPGYTYTWSTGSAGTTDSIRVGMSPGIFTVTLTDAGGCSTVLTDSILAPDTLTGSFTQVVQPGCGGGGFGSVTVTPTGGTPNASSPLYSYTWIGGGTNGTNDSIRVSIPPGTIRVVISDRNGCTSDTLTQVLGGTGIINPSFTSIVNPLCGGDSTGQLIVTPTGGSAPYTYNWNLGVAGATDSIRTNLPGGVQVEVVISEAGGCTDTARITLTDPTPITLTFTDSVLPTCSGGTNGSITVTPVGGTRPYTFNWSNSGTDSVGVGMMGGVFYAVTVTDDNGCTSIDSLQLTDPAPIALTFTDSSSVSCNGSTNGSITVTPSGGTPLYSYAWSSSLGGVVQTSPTSDSIAINLAGNATYTVTVTDGNGCTANASKTLDEPSAITAIGVGAAALCGLPTGRASLLFLNGGTPPYTITWDSAGTVIGTGRTITGLYAGVYTATVVDVNGCSEQFVVNVSNRLGPQITLDSLTDTHCDGVCAGEIDISVASFNNIPVTYIWSTGDTTQDVDSLCSGLVTVTVTDTNNCTRVQNFNIGVRDTLEITMTTTPLSCNATVCDGGVGVTPNNGVSPYSYIWSTSATDTNSSIINRCAGTYIVTVTDSLGCTATDSATLSSPTNLVVTTGSDSTTCFGGNDGVARVTGVSGGATPISYQWSTSATDTLSVNSGLSAGTYFVTVSEAGGCSVIDTVVVSQPPAIAVSVTTVDADCGLSNGVATATITSGGVSPFTYTWPVGGVKASNVDSNYAAGAYSVLVTDADGCSSTTPFNVNNINGPIVTLDSIRHETCAGSCDGAIFVSVTGGNPAYVYRWSPGGSTSQDTIGACPGVYDLRVTDQSGCVTLFTDTIDAASPVVPNPVVVANTTAKGACDGQAEVTPTGGTGPYTYNWSSGSTSDTANGLCAGAVYVTVTDSKGCTGIDSVVITEPDPIVLDSVNTILPGCGVVPCDGSIKIFVSGGTGTYTYIWDNGQTTDSTIQRCAGAHRVTVTDGSDTSIFTIPLSNLSASVLQMGSTPVTCNGGSDGTAFATRILGRPISTWSWSPAGGNSDTAKGLTAGLYTLTATNDSGCVTTDTISVIEPTMLVGTSDTTSPNCGLSDGMIVAFVSGGTGPYTISWLDASLLPLVPPQTGDTARNLSSGVYHYQVTDNNNCILTNQVILNDKNAPTIVRDSVRDVSCFGKCDGGIFITATGSGTLSYLWSPGGKTTPDLDSACAGNYNVMVTDAGGCTANYVDTIRSTDSLELTVTKISDASAASVCDGAASVTVNGGKPTYTYSWTGGSSSNIANNLCGGMNYVTVTDADGCQGVDSVEILEPITIILVSVDTTQPTCGLCDGKIKIVVGGGTAPYNYAWDNGDTADSTINRCAGVVRVTVTDANSLSQVFNIGLNNSTGPTVTLSTTNVSCNGSCDGTAMATGSGSTGPYTYNWPTLGSSSQSVTGLCAGTHMVEVRDALGCITTDSAVITEPTRILATADTTVADCGDTNGTVTLSVLGGVQPYTYRWSSGPVTTTPTLTGLGAGAYTVTIEDSTSCSTVLNFNITNPTGPLVTIDAVINETCIGSCNGSIFISASGATPPYSYSWSPGGMTTEDVSSLCAGVYSVEVRDANGCTTVLSDTVKSPTGPGQTIVVANNASGFGTCDGKAYVTIPGGTSGYRFQWSSSEVGDTARALCAGVNFVTITTPAGCQFIDSVVITQPQKIIISTKVVVNPDCNVCNGKVTVTVNGGIPPYTYLWDNGDTADSTVNRCAGTLFLTVTDSKGYGEIFSIGLSNTTAPNVSVTVNDVKCANACDGQAIAVGSGTVSPYTYYWPTLGVAGDTVNNLCAGTYDLEVTDKVGCKRVETVSIQAPDAIVTTLTAKQPNCGTADGVINSSVIGGLPSSTGYSYLWLDALQVPIVPSQTGDQLSNVAAGLFHLVVTDSNNCMDTTSISLSNNRGATIVLDSLTNPTCEGDCDGAIQVSSSNPFATYLWIPTNETTSSIDSLCEGDYTLELTDTSGCKTLQTFRLEAPDGFDVVAREIQNTTCPNTNDGYILTLINEIGAYTYSWTGPDGFTSTTKDVLNVLPGDYNLSVSNSKGCTETMTATVGSRVDYVISARGDSLYCGEQEVVIWVETSNSGLYATSWYDPDGVVIGNRDTVQITPKSGLNDYVVEVREDVCVVYDTVRVGYENNYVLDAGNDRKIVQGQIATIGGNPTAPDGQVIVWSPGLSLDDSTKLNPIASPEQTTMYIVRSGLEGGCKLADTVWVRVEDRIEVNDAFSPNGDGVNDTWVINVLEDYPDAKVQIFNRWGQLLYDEYPYVPWDGTFQGEPMQLGTYYYVIDLKDTTLQNPIISGPITIIR